MALHRSTWPVAVAACALLALPFVTGCSGDTVRPSRDTTPAAPPSTPNTPDTPSSTVRSSNGQAADSAWPAEARDAVNVVDDFWRSHWNTYFTGTYRSPKVFGTYTPGTPQAPACNGEPATPYNAFYCPSGDFIAWDGQLMRDGYARGDSWVYLVIAHEWGHAVQRRVLGLGVAAQELQADCLAGATLFGSDKLQFEPGDTDELAGALTALADDTPWTNSQDHGNAEQRVTAFSNGGRAGVRACLPARAAPDAP
ncbi:hypothetical protein [Streptomyces sp. MST-110588]|uniref:hypothetical protein n=1 Tax=Streptomyces sp. MST-110588 TaxID=2833628 RepID=UPI001F5C8484|nr:hypothetical protein [Streptomyces sp. MST-110588]UNO38674.1 hypothetical protein KGS77_02195 [Streptomyces sp. MST-110588]